MTHRPTDGELTAALADCGHVFSPDIVTRLADYCGRLWEWNENLNLTRHNTCQLFAARDVTDAVQLAEMLREGEEVLDVGSGGGAPGILLAILRPDLDVGLCDSVGKKARVLDEIVAELHLPVPVYHARAEELLHDLRFDAITARAVGPLWKLCKWFEPHWASVGRLLAVKGPRWPDERGEARHRGLMHGLQLRCAADYAIPGTDARSVILKIWPENQAER